MSTFRFAVVSLTVILAFAFLVAPPALTVGGDASPGDEYLFGNGGCSLAFPVKYGEGSRGFLTAAHCLAHGVPLEMDSNGKRFTLSRVASRVDSAIDDDEVSRDIALLGVSDELTVTAKVGGGFTVGDVVSAEEALRSIGSRACKFGSRTGMTCGVIESVNGEMVKVRGVYAAASPIVDHGDSGGALFLMEGFSTIRPLAVVSHGEHLQGQDVIDQNVLYGHLIAPTLLRWDLALLKD